MEVSIKTNFKRTFSNFFGAVGYLSCSLQWLWIVVLYFSWFKTLVVLVSPSGNSNPTKLVAPTVVEPNAALAIVSGIIVIAMLVVTLYFFYKIPATIIKTGKKTIQQTANTMAPLVLKAQHRKDTKKNLIKLTPKIIIILKLTLIVVPVLLAFFSQFIEKQMLGYQVAIITSLLLAGVSVIFFTLQYLLAKLLSIKVQEIW